MTYRLLADATLVLHLAFIAFALFGGVLVLYYPKLLRLHLAALGWGVLVQWANWICPLTPLENQLRQLGGQAGYAGGFIEHWLNPVLYPEQLTLELRYLLGLTLLLINAIIYACVIIRTKRQARAVNKPQPPLSNGAG